MEKKFLKTCSNTTSAICGVIYVPSLVNKYIEIQCCALLLSILLSAEVLFLSTDETNEGWKSILS
jgi:hypothetical protein